MKTDKTLSTIIHQIRPSLRQPYPTCSHLRLLSQHVPLRHPHPTFPHPLHTPKRGIPTPSIVFRSLETRRVSDSASLPSSAVALSTGYPDNPPNPEEPLPSYQLTFTCKPCRHRSTHKVTKLGYHHGSVLIKCPGCSNLHAISDHKKVGFSSVLHVGCEKRMDRRLMLTNNENSFLQTSHSPSRI